MIVFYLKGTGTCMLAIDCALSDITVSGNKAYYNGEVVNNDMTISAYTEVPKQAIFTPGPEGLPVPKFFAELSTGTTVPTDKGRISALEDTIMALLGV